VATRREKLEAGEGDLWDTGKVPSDRSINVVYEGAELRSRMRCWWKVRVWDREGEPGRYSEPAWWEMALLDRSDWGAQWISISVPEGLKYKTGPSPFLRRKFEVKGKMRRARVYVSGLGYYELYLNGKKVGDHVLDPAFTRYDRRVLYVTYDVTGRVSEGPNVVGAILGNGWYNMHTRAVWDFDRAPWRDRPALKCRLEIAFEDGKTLTVVSDRSWKVSTGPIRFESIRNGEFYDARLEIPGWSTPAFDDSEWKAAEVVPGPKGKLCAQSLPPIKVMKTLTPVKITEPKSGLFVFDMGQNMAGWARLKVSGPRGTKVVMRFGERLNPDGTVDRKEIAKFVKEGAFQTDTYILKGEGVEIWEPRFTYHGFQYVEVSGLPGKPTKETISGRMVHTSFRRAGSFECSNDLLNRIQRNTCWSYVSNFHGYPTDCPHREKNGWTGDAHLAAEQGLYNFLGERAYAKWMNDFKDEQRPSGELPGIVPTSGWGYKWGNGPAWDSAYILIPWYLYLYRGDVRILSEHYDRFKRYVDYLTSRSSGRIVAIGLGDWAPAETKTPEKVTSTGYYYRDALLVSKIAKILGHGEDARKYGEVAREIKRAFNDAFYNPATGLYSNGSQTALSCALYHGLADGGRKTRVLGNLVSAVARADWHLDCGILGTKYLLRSLSENGRTAVAYRIATRRSFPSWGWWIRQGATTLWEQWNGDASRNHIMFGDVSAWFYRALAGINPDPENPGFKHIVIRPEPVADLKWVRARHLCPYGEIESSWRRREKEFVLEITVPVNTTASVYVPVPPGRRVFEGGKPAREAPGVKFVGEGGGKTRFEVGSGKYRFTVR